MPVLWHKFNMRVLGRVPPLWAHDLLNEWNDKKDKEINSTHYNTNFRHWYCSCIDYLLSRFHLCKHLCQTDPLQNINIDFKKVTRNDSYPFLEIPGIPQSTSVSHHSHTGVSYTHMSEYLAQLSVPEPAGEEPEVDECRMANEIMSGFIEDLTVFQQENSHNHRALQSMLQTMSRATRAMEEYKANKRRRLLPTTSSLRGPNRYID